MPLSAGHHRVRGRIPGAVRCRGAFASAMMAAGLLAVSAGATVKDGVDAWSAGDYERAVSEWEGPAAEGDPDALFNLAQAYRFGRGVETDLKSAETLYSRAAGAGHIQAADALGLLLFQSGRREQALPYVQDAAGRGDPRAQYLIGIAHFNGDLVQRDWVRAYALMTRANAQGLSQATDALREMDKHVPMAQRQEAATLARQMESEAEQERQRRLTAADLAVADAVASSPARPAATSDGQVTMAAGSAPPVDPATAPPRPERPAATSTAQAAPTAASAQPSDPAQAPQRIPTPGIAPTVASSRAAIIAAREATGTSDPAMAGASYVEVSPMPQAAAPPSPPAPGPAPAPAPASAAARTPAPQQASTGPWRVQLGAFSVESNATSLWDRLSGRSEIAGMQRLLIPAGRVTKLQAGGYASRADAQAACRSLKAAGQECLVTRE